MLSLKSYYRFNEESQSQFQSIKTSRQECITPGICDYIPYHYFSKQYFSIYIEGIDINQIIQSVLWNQYYQKTLLKEIYSQLTTARKNQTNLISKLDSMMSKVSQMSHLPQALQAQKSQIIYLKIHNKVYNLKDKLEYENHSELEKHLKQTKCLNVQKISKQGKWKKIIIEFGPYKNKSEFDIVFSAVQPPMVSQKDVNIKQENQNVLASSQKDNTQRGKSTKNQTKHSIKNEIKNSKSVPNSSTKNKQNKQSPLYATATKSMSKSKISNTNSINGSAKKSKAILSESTTKKRERKSSISKIQPPLAENHQSSIRKSIQKGSIKKGINLFERTSSDLNILKEVNFNSTAKLSNHLSHITEDQILIPPQSLDLMRKQKLRVKQNSIMEEEIRKNLIQQSEIMKSYADLGKNNSVLAQILSKKEETIQLQKIKLQNEEKKHLKEIEQLRLKHQKQTEGFKTEISTILNEYNKKYQQEKQDAKKLRQQLASINQVLTENKVFIAELQAKQKSTQDEAFRYKNENQELKKKLQQTEEKLNTLVVSSREQKTKLITERDYNKQSADKYLQKYNNIYKKMKGFLQEQEN